MATSIKNILITGGAKGLGAHLARHLSAEGHRIVVLDRTPIDALAPEYRETLAEYATVDLEDWPAVRDAATRMLENRLQRIDVLINNAGCRIFGDFARFDESEIAASVQVNFETPLLLTRTVLPVMRRQGYGRIINVSSYSALHPYASGTLYCSTKSALVVFTEALAAELEASGEDITANVICPDSFRTREREELPAYGWMMKSVAQTVDRLLNSSSNGKVIPLASRRRLAKDAIIAFRKQAKRLLKR